MSRVLNSANVRRLAVAVFVLGGLAFGGSTATASGGYAPHCYWKTVTVYEIVTEPCVHYVTRYTDCGRPYRVKVVTYKTVRVPVQKRVKVCY